MPTPTPVVRRRMGRKRTDSNPEPVTPSMVLKAIIEEKSPGLAIAEIARRSGIARPNVSRVLSGEAPFPAIQTVESILMAVGSDLCHYRRTKKRIESITDSA